MPAHFAILRTAKLKSFGNVGGSLSHTYRTRETTNADPDRADTNEHSHSSPTEVMQALRDRLPDKYRKDAVIGLEYFVGASPRGLGVESMRSNSSPCSCECHSTDPFRPLFERKVD